MYKADPPAGWRLLDEFHSPGQTARYVKDRGDGYYHVVDVVGTGGIGEFSVHKSVERVIFEEGPNGARPYINTDVRSERVLAENVSEERAFEVAMQEMSRSGGGSRSNDTDIFGGFF